MIQLSDVVKHYPARGGRHTVLAGISATFPLGRNVGILGRNGSGKSTLIRLMAKAEFPTRGRVRHQGRVSWPLGFAGGFQPSMTARDNIVFVAGIYGAPPRSTIDRVEAFAGLGRYLEMPVQTLSSGMRARLAFGLSLAIEFDFYLMDELSAVGDERFRARSQAALQELRGRSTFIIVSHQMGQIKRFCDTAYVLEKGQLLDFDHVDQAIAAYQAL